MAGEAPKAAFDVGRMAMGGFGQMLDGVEFMKRAWSSTLNLPGSFVPTVDIDELDKRIADLKAVEQWLNMNLSMLRGTVQALEVQRGTLAAIKAFGSTLGAAPRAGDDDTEAAAALRRAMAEIAARTATAPVAPPPAASSPAKSAPAESAAAGPTAAERRPSGSRARAASAGTQATAPGGRSPAAPSPVLPAINPGAWWNLLQQNFNQVAEAALSGVGLQAAPSASPAAGAKRPAPKQASGTAPERGRAGATAPPRKRSGSRPPRGGA